MGSRCIIVDDDPISIDILSKYIAMVPVLELMGTYTNSLHAFNLLLKTKVDLIYLDIEMPDIKGIDLVKALQNPPAIIFTTAHKEFATEAFDLNAVDYLLKPISFDRFLRGLNKLSQYNFPKSQEISGKTSNHIYFRTNKKRVKVILEDIRYIECLKDYVLIHRTSEPDLKIKLAFNTLEAILPRNTFLRIHRSFIISKPKITAYSHDFVEMGKTEIPIGGKYKNVTAVFDSE